MRLLFVKGSLAWPRSSGHDVHTFYAMKACAALGHEIGLVTSAPPAAEAIAGLPLAYSGCLQGHAATGLPVTLSRVQERFRSYWGVERSTIDALRQSVQRFRPDAVVVAGLDALPLLAGIEGAVRVWYAADEWVWHHLSLVQARVPATYTHVKAAALKGLYERAYAPLVDRAWVVSETERRAMRWLAGVRHVDVFPNGVDADHFAPIAGPAPVPHTAVFWGRLDFEPNIQGLQWFCDRIWPAVRRAVPDARFTILGFKPMAEAEALGRLPGVELIANLPDLRAEVQRRGIVVLPFVSGGGIKNKLLEAAAMALPVVCTPRALNGLRSPSPDGLITATDPQQWVEALTRFWNDPDARARAGAAARAWVVEQHSWAAGARSAMAGLASEPGLRGRA
ncbi:MAG: glycosyltransferase family 4 protein [Vicinamibacterales bacterium]